MEETAAIYPEKKTEVLTNKKILISVCVPTFQRPQLLEKLLDSLENQLLPPDTGLELIIVDNDAAKSAESIVKKFSPKSRHICKYFSQPVKNISLTRNMSVKQAAGDYLFFIDDDEYAPQNLIKIHLETLNRYNADAVFGMVKPYFHDQTPGWLREREFYYSKVNETGKPARYFFTSNTLVRASIIKESAEPFDAGYGITGGEDSYLFNKLYEKGYKFINCREAVAMEYIPPQRTTHKYLFTRAFKGGNSFVRRVADQYPHKRTSVFAGQFFKAAAQLVFYTIKLLLVIYSRKKSFAALLRLYANLGKVTAVFGYTYKGYK